ncbi:cysteine desulfurase family protein [Oxalobacteraceae bacterium A2-2]
MSTIYFDNNATTPPSPAVMEAVHASLCECWGNPSSKHQLGAAAQQALRTARAQVAALIGAAPAEIVFTASATEANHQAILGALAGGGTRRHVVASAVEHAATRQLLERLEGAGVEVTRVGVDGEGRLDLAGLAAAIRPDTALVTLMWANNETGVVYPVAEAAALARARGALFHTDATQAAGRLAIDLGGAPIDLLTLAGHKFHGPKGAAALYVRKGVALAPQLHGSQERGRRGGTENLPAIVGLGVAAQAAAGRLAPAAAAMAALRARLERGLLQRLPQARVLGAGAARLPNTSAVCLGQADAGAVLELLDRAGVCAARGAACGAGGSEPSPVLLAMGLSASEALATLRFSLSRYSRADEVDALLALLPGIVARAGTQEQPSTGEAA